jgi:Ni,Fe-hydrogenase I cytochrome b subunit
MHICAIPPYLNTIYNLIVDPSTPLAIPHLTLVLTGLALLLTCYYLYKFYKNPYRGKLACYSFLMMLAIVLVSASGYAHIIILPVAILIFAWDLRKEIPINEYRDNYKLPVVRHAEEMKEKKT